MVDYRWQVEIDMGIGTRYAAVDQFKLAVMIEVCKLAQTDPASALALLNTLGG